MEEFDINSDELIVRRVKHPTDIGEGRWEFEVGESQRNFNPDTEMIAVSNSNVKFKQPVFVRKDTLNEF